MRDAAAALSEPWSLRLYRAASRALGPVAELALAQRLKEGKEDPDRIGERRGVAGKPRPEGEICWLHGASVGESLSVLPLVDRLRTLLPGVQFLVTTGTTTSARLMAERLPEGAIHQYIPLDHPRYVEGFLDHWRPDAVVFVESEFWPNLILSARARTRYMALVNGRVSPKSFEDWSRKKETIRFVLSAFDLILAQDRQNAQRLAALSGRETTMLGNLKSAAAPLPADPMALEALRGNLGGRPVFLAASTHEGEEDMVFEAHRLLKASYPGLLTIIAPRHPARGRAIASAASSGGLTARARSSGGGIGADIEVYIADTLGELGLFYRLAPIAFVGGSLVAKGGHNPLEPARLGGAVLHGPHIFNFAETYGAMRAAGGAALVRNAREIASAVGRLIADPKTREAMASAAQRLTEANAERILGDIGAAVAGGIAGAGRAA